MAVPIWKACYVSLGSTDGTLFRIRANSNSGTIIYTGKAFLRPGETAISVRINDICAVYLSNVLPFMSDAEFSRVTLPMTFYIQKSTNNGSSWSNVTNVQFTYDWSYDYDYDVATMGMSFPILPKADARQWIVYTAYNASSVTATIRYKDGTSSTQTIPVAVGASFNDDFNSDLAKSVRVAGSGTAVFSLASWNNVKSITIGNTTYEVTTDCASYVLYYLNAYGGWDSMLIEGTDMEHDDISRSIMAMEYDNQYISNRGRRNYVNEVDKQFTLHTAVMTDVQSKAMHHLIESTNVYLYDIAQDQMIPVIVTDSALQYKTYRNNGNRMVSYDINVQVAQDRVRR